MTFPGAQIQGLNLLEGWRLFTPIPLARSPLQAEQPSPNFASGGAAPVTSYLNKAEVNTTGFNWLREKSTDLASKTWSFHPVLYLHTQTHSGLGSTVLMGHWNLGCSCSCELIRQTLHTLERGQNHYTALKPRPQQSACLHQPRGSSPLPLLTPLTRVISVSPDWSSKK